MNASKSGKPREPWEREEEDPEPVHLPFRDVEEQAQWSNDTWEMCCLGWTHEE